MTAIEAIATFHDDLVTWRRDIHAYPELGFEESRTSEFVADKLASFGLEVQRGIAKTGIVATLQAGTSNRAIGLRADMDALPIQEANDFDHCSHHAGKMHAYGHDGHTTMLLGAARYLAGNPTFDGRVHFIFQPAEEGLGGAKAMIAEGLFDRFPMENIYGMHNSPGMPAGTFAIRPGPMMAGGAFFDIAIDGVGAHGARPEHSVDPVIAASYITTALQTIVARNTKPVDTAVRKVTASCAGGAPAVALGESRSTGRARVPKINVAVFKKNRKRSARPKASMSCGGKMKPARPVLTRARRGTRPRAPRDQRTESYIFAAMAAHTVLIVDQAGALDAQTTSPWRCRHDRPS